MAPERRQDMAAAGAGPRADGAADAGASTPPLSASGPASSASKSAPECPPGAAPPGPPQSERSEQSEPGGAARGAFQSMPSFGDAESWIGETCDAAVSAAEKRFDEKAEDIFRSASKMLEQIDEQQTRAQARLEEEVRRCGEVNRRLEEQKASIEQMVQQMQAQLAIAESAAQLRASGFSTPSMTASAPPGLPGGMHSWRMPGMPGQWPGLPLLADPGALTDSVIADFAGGEPVAIRDGPGAAGGSTGGSGGDDQAKPPVISLLNLLGSRIGEGSETMHRAWTVTDLSAPEEQPGSSSQREFTPPPKITVRNVDALSQQEAAAKKAHEEEEDGIRTPPGLLSPNRARILSAGEDLIPYHLMSPKPKPRPVPEDYDEYLERMARGGEWGDHVTLQAACDTLCCEINVLAEQSGASCLELRPVHSLVIRGPLCLLFLPEFHYDAAVPIE